MSHSRMAVLLACVLLLVPGCKRHADVAAPDAGSSGDLASIEPLPAPIPLTIPDAGAVSDLLDVVALTKAKTFTSLKEARRTPERVFKLDLSNQGLTNLAGISRLTRLQSLDLSHNELHDVTALTALKRLQRLDLSFNPVRKLPIDLGMLEALEELDVSRAPELATVPLEVGKLQRLRILRIGSERLKRLPDELTRLPSLSVLSLQGCLSLTALPDDMGALKALTELDLGRTGLPPAEFDRLKAALPNVRVLGIPGEVDAEAGVDSEQTARRETLLKRAAELAEAPCDEVLEKGRAPYLAPLVEDDDVAILVDGEESPLGKVVEHYAGCREEADQMASQSLSPRLTTRMAALKDALTAFEEARATLLEVSEPEETRSVVLRLAHQAQRADVLAEVLRALRSHGEEEDADVASGSARASPVYKLQKQLIELSGAPDPEHGSGYGAAYAALKDAAKSLQATVRPLPERAQFIVYRRMEDVLKE